MGELPHQDMYLVCIVMYQVCIYNVSTVTYQLMYQMSIEACIVDVSIYVSNTCIKHISFAYRLCIVCVSYVYHDYVSCVYRVCIVYVSSLRI